MKNRVFFILAGLAVAACQPTESVMTESQTTESATLASTLPIADLHMHDAFGMAKAESRIIDVGSTPKNGHRPPWSTSAQVKISKFG